MKICEKCNAVIACRVSPKQKQEVVSLVRNAVNIYFLKNTNNNYLLET